MKKIMAFVLGLIFFATTQAWCSDLRNLTFVQTIESIKEGRLFEAKTWMKEGKVRMEYMAGEEMMVSVIKEGKIFNFSPFKKVGAVMNVQKNVYGEQIGPEVIQSEKELMEFLDLMQAKVVGEETILGKSCIIYEYMDAQNNVLNRIWLWKDVNVPIKSTIHASGDVITILYQDIKIDKTIPDSLFNLPADINLEDYTKMSPESRVQSPESGG